MPIFGVLVAGVELERIGQPNKSRHFPWRVLQGHLNKFSLTEVTHRNV